MPCEVGGFSDGYRTVIYVNHRHAGMVMSFHSICSMNGLLDIESLVQRLRQQRAVGGIVDLAASGQILIACNGLSRFTLSQLS